jgi:hypothetical protein
MASGESHNHQTRHRRLVDISPNHPRLRARSQWQARCAKSCGAVERKPRELNPDRPRGNCRPVSHNSVFLSGDGLAAAPLITTSAHLIDPIITEMHQDLKSEKRKRSLEPVDTEKALAIVPPLVLDRLAHVPRQRTRAITQKAPRSAHWPMPATGQTATPHVR